MAEVNSIFFYKNQRPQLHKLIDFILDYNQSLPSDKCDGWDNMIDIKIHNEDDNWVVEFADKMECQGFTYIDENHYVVPDPSSPIWLDIDEDASYLIPSGENDYCHYTISGDKLKTFINKNKEVRQ